MIQRGAIMVNVLNRKAIKIIERWSPTFSQWYADFRVSYGDGTEGVVKLRHMRSPMTGERSAYPPK